MYSSSSKWRNCRAGNGNRNDNTVWFDTEADPEAISRGDELKFAGKGTGKVGPTDYEYNGWTFV